MSEKSYHVPAICWLKVTEYIQGWLQNELGGEVRVKDQRVVCVQHLPGARDVLKMETCDDLPTGKAVGNAISATWRNALEAGMAFDEGAIEREYGVTKETLRGFVPIECPRNALTKYGVLRPWSNDTCFGDKQATAMQRLLREAFWDTVGEFAKEYAQEHKGQRYSQQDMIEDFCLKNKINDIHVESMRREWQRRAKRKASALIDN